METTKFFKSIDFNSELNAEIKNVILKRSTETFTVTLTLKEFSSSSSSCTHRRRSPAPYRQARCSYQSATSARHS